MSTPVSPSGGSRHANGTYPAQPDREPETVDSDTRPDVPHPSERLEGLWDRYGDRLMRPVVAAHGAKVREECLEEPETYSREVEIGDYETREVEEVVERRAKPWFHVIADFLEDYERYRNLWLRMAKGREYGGERETFELPVNNSYHPKYQRKQYARLKAMKRQLVGESAEESPTGEEYAGAYEEPVTVLFGLTASSLTDGGGFRSPVDHDRAIRDAWGGSSGVRRTLRYVVEDRLGVPSDRWAYWFQSEPHPGGGKASGYSHAHPVVVLDRADAEEEIVAETFRPVVAKHVAECEGAEGAAHQLEDAVTVKEPGEVNDWASYVSEYVAVSPDQDLLERSDEYLMWAASQWASGTQKYSKSGTATAAIQADACHQRYVSSEADQSADHGDRVRRDGSGGWECAECGSSHGIDQSEETLTARRLATDGGEEGGDRSEEGGEDAGLSLRERWPSARSAARVGGPPVARECDHADGAAECPLCCEDGERVSGDTPIPDSAEPVEEPEEEREAFERVPRWKAVAVVDRAREEEHEVMGVGGVDYGEVVVAGAEGVGDYGRLLPSDVSGPEPWTRCSFISEEEVRSGEVPPPEVLGRYHAEVREGRPQSRKVWHDDWYSRRYEREDVEEPDAAGGGGVDTAVRSAVRDYLSRRPSASVAEVAGAVAGVGGPEQVAAVVEDERGG